MKVSSGMCLRFERRAFYSPVYLKNSNSAQVEVTSICVCCMSTVGMLNPPALLNKLPMSVRLSMGETMGETPPSRSASARFRQIRSS